MSDPKLKSRIEWLDDLEAPPSDLVAKQYGTWLGAHDWSHWITCTFGKWVPSESAAMRAWKRVTALPTLEGMNYFVCVERGEKYGRTHLHALARFPLLGTPRITDFDAEWRARYGITHIRDYRPAAGADAYAAKYCTKDLGDWDYQWTNVISRARRTKTEQARLGQGPGSCTGESKFTQRNKKSPRQKSSPRVDLRIDRHDCNTNGIEVIDLDSPHAPRTPKILSMYPITMVSVGPST